MSYTAEDVEKQADEVYEKFYALVPAKTYHFGVNMAISKQCALLYCDGVLDCIDKFNMNGSYCKGYANASYMDADVAEKFWNEVKQTIKNK